MQSPSADGIIFFFSMPVLYLFWQDYRLPSSVANLLSGWAGLAPSSYMAKLTALQVTSGRRDPEDLANTMAIKALLPFLSLLVCALSLAPELVPISLLLFWVPDLLLLLLVKRRQRAIVRPLPDTIDLLVLCLESGLGLDAAIKKVIQKQPRGALTDELELLSHQLMVGVSREQAYRDLHARTGVEPFKRIGSALIQSTRHGHALAPVLRAQSELLRNQAGTEAERRANKIPIWMTFPMCFLILPALLMLLAGPALLQNRALVTSLGTGQGQFGTSIFSRPR